MINRVTDVAARSPSHFPGEFKLESWAENLQLLEPDSGLGPELKPDSSGTECLERDYLNSNLR